jgi:DNA polymerase alpha subunit A
VAPPAEAARPAAPSAPAQGTPAAAAAAPGGAASKTPWRTPAGAKAAAEAATPATAAPAAGWQRMYSDGEAEGDEAEAGGEEAAPAAAPWQDDGSLPLGPDARLPFYMLDAHEEAAQPGVVFLFGKVPAGPPGQFLSACAVVRGMSRSVFFVPRAAVGSPEIAALHAAAGGGDAAAKKALVPLVHAAFSAVKAEVRALLTHHGVTQMTMKPVVRQYAFENRGVPHGKQWVLKVRYPAAHAALPLGLAGDTFAAAFGANQGSLEALLLKRRVMGPGWVALRQPRRVEAGAQVSYCRLEVEVDGHKAVFAGDGSRPAPPLTVAALHLKTVTNPATAANEVAAASVVYLPRVSTDGPTTFARRDLRHFSAVRRLDCHGVVFPPGFDAQVRAANEGEVGRRNGGAVLAAQPNERALLTWLVMRLRDVDADVFVGHNFAAFDLDVLLHRMQALKVPHWASLGRLKRSRFPSLGGGGHTFGGGAGAGALSVVAGRLLCDTYLAARDLVREVDYTLGTLSRTLLGEARAELAPQDIPAKYATPAKLLELVRHTESDAWLSLRLSFYLVVLPLTRQLAELSGSLWSRALMNQRAQRIEMLLLHEFHDHKFLLPDKMTQRERERLLAAEAAAEGGPPEEEEGGGGGGSGGAPAKPAGGKRSKGPQYAGGLVLEPKKGLYEKYVLLLDFNSLYPSIIQEYNICFTTVHRPPGGGVPALPEPGGEKAPLPRVIGALVARRRRVKELIKSERDGVKREQLNIRQQALKLLANSMYGCLGFANSRFYARPLAELITSQGREILQSTVDLVQGTVGREVIYGDTDSIMVYTGSDSLAEVTALGGVIKREVNKRYRLLEIEVDGVYRCMLLLKKKKYAAVKVERGADGRQVETVEAKGLDMVRRDWSPLAKQASQFALDRVLSCAPRDEVVAAIHEHLTALAAAVVAGEVPLNKYVVTKQLTKRPEDYPDAKSQPHVQVALRRKAAGKRDGTMAVSPPAPAPGASLPAHGVQPALRRAAPAHWPLTPACAFACLSPSFLRRERRCPTSSAWSWTPRARSSPARRASPTAPTRPTSSPPRAAASRWTPSTTSPTKSSPSSPAWWPPSRAPTRGGWPSAWAWTAPSTARTAAAAPRARTRCWRRRRGWTTRTGSRRASGWCCAGRGAGRWRSGGCGTCSRAPPPRWRPRCCPPRPRAGRPRPLPRRRSPSPSPPPRWPTRCSSACARRWRATTRAACAATTTCSPAPRATWRCAPRPRPGPAPRRPTCAAAAPCTPRCRRATCTPSSATTTASSTWRARCTRWETAATRAPPPRRSCSPCGGCSRRAPPRRRACATAAPTGGSTWGRCLAGWAPEGRGEGRLPAAAACVAGALRV